MKNNKIIVITLLSLLTLIILACAYIYVIQGEKLDMVKNSWLIDTPIAHRGLDNGSVPENSIQSFEKAIEHNYAIELDVQLTKDNELVVFHDDNLERLTGDTRDVKDVEYKELKSLKLENTQETIPTLKEVIELVDDKVPLLVEIKDGENAEQLAQKTYEIMKDYKGRYAVQSFNPFILQWFKENASEVIRCQLSCNFIGDQDGGLKGYEKFVLKNLLLNFKSKPHVIAYDVNAVDNLSVKLLKNKYPVVLWTIKNEEQMKTAYEKGDNIIFDNILP